MKKSIVVIIIGLALFVGGYFLHENTIKHAGSAYSGNELNHVYSLLNYAGYMKTAGIIIGIAGCLWLIVIAIQQNRKQ